MKTRRKQKLGLALSSGGIPGYAHIGVLRALEDLHVQIDLLSGASIGAVVAVSAQRASTRQLWKPSASSTPPKWPCCSRLSFP